MLLFGHHANFEEKPLPASFEPWRYVLRAAVALAVPAHAGLISDGGFEAAVANIYSRCDRRRLDGFERHDRDF